MRREDGAVQWMANSALNDQAFPVSPFPGIPRWAFLRGAHRYLAALRAVGIDHLEPEALRHGAVGEALVGHPVAVDVDHPVAFGPVEEELGARPEVVAGDGYLPPVAGRAGGDRVRREVEDDRPSRQDGEAVG